MLDLSAENKILFDLIRANHSDAPGRESGMVNIASFSADACNINWDEVKKEASHQAVYLLAASSKSLPEQVKKQWKPSTMAFIAANAKSQNAAVILDQIMRKHNFRYVIIKGLSSAYYYPDYFSRSLGDCDFLIDVNQKDEVMKALEQEGFEASGLGGKHHVVFKKPAHDLEMHFDIPGIPDDLSIQDCIRSYISDILTDTISFDVDGHEIILPSAKNHGLVILLHMQQHTLTEGIGIRHILDWGYFIEKTQGEAFWEEELLPAIKQIGLFKYACVMARVGNRYLGTPLPAWVADTVFDDLDKDSQLVDDIMADVLTGGNFGQKNMARSVSNMMFHDKKGGTTESKFTALWRTLVSVVRGKHPKVLAKCPTLFWALFPVFMIEFFIGRLYRVLTGKSTSLFVSSRYVEERKSVYDRLEVFEVKKYNYKV